MSRINFLTWPLIHAWTNELTQIFHTQVVSSFQNSLYFLKLWQARHYLFHLCHKILWLLFVLFVEDVENSVVPLHTRGVPRLNVVHLMVRQPQAPRTLHLAATDHLRYRVLEQYIRCHCINFLEGTNNILNNRHTCALHVTYEIIIIVNFIIMELNSTNNVISNDIIMLLSDSHNCQHS